MYWHPTELSSWSILITQISQTCIFCLIDKAFSLIDCGIVWKYPSKKQNLTNSVEAFIGKDSLVRIDPRGKDAAKVCNLELLSLLRLNLLSTSLPFSTWIYIKGRTCHQCQCRHQVSPKFLVAHFSGSRQVSVLPFPVRKWHNLLVSANLGMWIMQIGDWKLILNIPTLTRIDKLLLRVNDIYSSWLSPW